MDQPEHLKKFPLTWKKKILKKMDEMERWEMLWSDISFCVFCMILVNVPFKSNYDEAFIDPSMWPPELEFLVGEVTLLGLKVHLYFECSSRSKAHNLWMLS